MALLLACIILLLAHECHAWFSFGGGVGQTPIDQESAPVDPGHLLADLHKRANSDNDPTAQRQLGEMFYSGGQGRVVEDHDEAVRLFTLSAEQGDVHAQRKLGHWYLEGTAGVARDPAEALEWYLKAAEQGDVYSQHNVAYLNEHGHDGQGDADDIPRDHDEAAKWYRRAAEDHAHAASARQMGHLIADDAIAGDEAEAARYYAIAAEKGDPEASTALGLLYYDGKGGLPRDRRKAIELWLKAAKKGDEGAHYALGKIHNRMRKREQFNQAMQAKELEDSHTHTETHKRPVPGMHDEL